MSLTLHGPGSVAAQIKSRMDQIANDALVSAAQSNAQKQQEALKAAAEGTSRLSDRAFDRIARIGAASQGVDLRV